MESEQSRYSSIFSVWLRSRFFSQRCRFVGLVPYPFATNVLVAPFQQGFYFQPEYVEFTFSSSGHGNAITRPGKTNPRFPDGSGQRFSMYKRHQARDTGFVILPRGPIDLPDITQMGKLIDILPDTFMCDGFIACHSSFNRFVQRAFMQMRLTPLDKSMGNALGYGQQPHSFYLVEPVLEHQRALVDCL